MRSTIHVCWIELMNLDEFYSHRFHFLPPGFLELPSIATECPMEGWKESRSLFSQELWRPIVSKESLSLIASLLSIGCFLPSPVQDTKFELRIFVESFVLCFLRLIAGTSRLQPLWILDHDILAKEDFIRPHWLLLWPFLHSFWIWNICSLHFYAV